MKELKDFTTKELAELMDKNAKLHEKMAEIADECFTQWDINDFFRDCPRMIDEDSYGRLMIARYSNTNVNRKELIEWAEERNNDYCFIPADNVPDFEKAVRYIEVMREDDCGCINMKQKDYEHIEKYVSEVVDDIIGYMQSYYIGLRTQFEDTWYLADALLSCEMLDDYYQRGDGKIYKRCADRLIA